MINGIRLISAGILVAALAATGICDIIRGDFKTAILAFLFSIANVFIFFIK